MRDTDADLILSEAFMRGRGSTYSCWYMPARDFEGSVCVLWEGNWRGLVQSQSLSEHNGKVFKLRDIDGRDILTALEC